MNSLLSHWPWPRAAHALRGVAFGLMVGVVACESTSSAALRAPSNARSQTTRCEAEEAKPAAAIASAPLNLTRPVQLVERVKLLGEEAPSPFTPQQNVTSGLRTDGGRLYIVMDSGWWDISRAGDARWYASSSILVLAVRAADLDGDGDGDSDLLLLTYDVNPAARDDAAASPLTTRLTVWERTAEGLTERSEVLRVPHGALPIPYDAGDLDRDGDLDVVSYERGTPVGYVHDGAFGFTRTVRGATTPAYADKPLAYAHYTNRNDDGAPDLLTWTGEALELNVFTLLGNADAGFGMPGPAVTVGAPLVPHGPIGMGFWMADVTGDGLEDLVTQDAQGSDDAPMLNLFVSERATRIAPATQLAGLGFEFADVDLDGRTDIITTRDERLTALLSRTGGSFEVSDLGIDMGPPVMDWTIESGLGGPPILHVLYSAPQSDCTAESGSIGEASALLLGADSAP
jgi:hypothetical protein